MNYKEKLAACAIKVPDILLPRKFNSLEKWAVIACDQFSSDKEYWEKEKKRTEGTESTLNLILPECYLDESDKRVPEINKTMKEYLEKDILGSLGEGFIYMNRSTPYAPGRKGLIVALDLENYSYEAGAECAVRPTEGTVLERLPVRAEIRKNAVLDIPHILVLLDDKENKLFSYLEKRESELKKVYDFDLAGGAGHLSGSLVEDESDLTAVADIFDELNRKSDFLFAVGDGNHSLGAAKQLWNKIKEETGDMDHPSRYALVELENIHDEGVHFHPIHRVLFDCSAEKFTEDLKAFPGTEFSEKASWKEMEDEVIALSGEGVFALGMISGEHYSVVRFENKEAFLASEAFHAFLDPWMEEGQFSEIDYIHGDDVLCELSSNEKNIGFYLPPVNKSTFFSFISTRGPMPRKTFSIGEAEEKRYYLECRKLIR
ncbi:MAG: DUF1015 domain-containing protein [Spirochaetales bacterium]|nr:DUF1015 domain-containing protein [Spirochaetales bacterium]